MWQPKRNNSTRWRTWHIWVCDTAPLIFGYPKLNCIKSHCRACGVVRIVGTLTQYGDPPFSVEECVWISHAIASHWREGTSAQCYKPDCHQALNYGLVVDIFCCKHRWCESPYEWWGLMWRAPTLLLPMEHLGNFLLPNSLDRSFTWPNANAENPITEGTL